MQAGLEGASDTEVVARLGNVSSDRVVPERYRLRTAASPHQSAEIDGVRIDVDSVDLRDSGMRPLIANRAPPSHSDKP
ncbi:AAA family ATPase [Bradyrhizobium sp. 521_C7_N1_3]|uniref:AAA family ATPase n=1 Tax=Bradyrhizobium sp. 521_C7_N1_3 TaxID=3240368 RepID=UPI003F88B7B7